MGDVMSKREKKEPKKLRLIHRDPLPVLPIELVKFLEAASDEDFHSIWCELVSRTGEGLFSDDDN